jgi:RNA polymerase sigma-70 factor (ECF subfamily)
VGQVSVADAARPDELDDLTLARAQRGEAPACRALVARYERRVFALLSRMVGRRGRALVEDLAQETFLRVFRALGGFSPGGAARLSTWILTIATRLALDELARRRPEAEPLSLALVDGMPRADGTVEARAVGRAIERAVRGLPPVFQAVFVLREYHGLEYDEIARALELDVGTVKSRLSRARAALRQALEEVRP